jgi:hypothetical protein
MSVEKSIIIQLIKQDLKHTQLLEGIKAAGFKSELHYLDLSTIVALLMGVPKGEASDQWAEVYLSFLMQAASFELTPAGDNLDQLAEECYLFLQACEEIEKRCRTVREEFNYQTTP